MKRRYFLMRHADAGPYAPDEAMDRARHLTPAGEKQAQDAADRVAQKNNQPSCVYSDDSTRCVQTAEIVADTLGIPHHYDARVAEPDTLKQAIKEYANAGARPLFVTHDHTISDLAKDYDEQDLPQLAEIRRMKGKKEKARY